MTDALQQRSRYQCALKRSEERISCTVGEFLLFIVKNTDVSFDCSWKLTEGTFKQNTRIKIPCNSISISF